MVRVVNKRTHAPTPDDCYIGRGSVLGNPYTCKDLEKTKAEFQSATREESIESYIAYLNAKIEEGNNDVCDELNRIYLKALKGDVNLVCYCKPLGCHGDFIKGIIDSKILKNFLKK